MSPTIRSRRSGGRSARRRLLRGLALLLVAVPLAYAAWTWATWPDVAALVRSNPPTTAFIEHWKRNRRAAGEPDEVAWTFVAYARISPHLKRAVIVAEDIEFFSHQGFAIDEIKRALGDAWDQREFPRGASTISQQLAKNLWLSPSRNPVRKLKEALLTRQLERTLSKPRILELYLNVVEFGPGVYGAEAAARRYFGRAAAVLDEEQAARLAAGLPRPTRWHPGVSSRAYDRRAAAIRRRMERASWLWKVI